MLGRRVTDRLIEYWKRLKKEDALPYIGTFHAETIKDIWPSCFTLSVISSSQGSMYQYDYVGSEIIKSYGKDMTGEKIGSNLTDVPGKRIIMKIDQIITSKEPLIEEGTFVNKKNQVIKHRTCILPFTNSPENKVTNIIVGINWLVRQ